MNKCAPILTTLLASAVIGCTPTMVEWPTAKQRAAAHVDGADCAKAWDLLWPWAKNGRTEARAILAGGIHASGLTPPGASTDAVTRFRNLVILTVHGAADGDATTMTILKGLLASDLATNIGGRKLKTCLDAGRAPDVCVRVAIESGFVPSFAEYARQIDATASSSPRPAQCALPRNTPLPVPVQRK